MVQFVGWVRTFVLGVAAGAAIAFGISQIAATDSASWEEWTLPARFEGEGALTLGCAFWDVPRITAYGAENPKVDHVVVGVSGERGNVEALFSIDGPQGTAFVSGEKCAVSVDWSSFPVRERPAE